MMKKISCLCLIVVFILLSGCESEYDGNFDSAENQGNAEQHFTDPAIEILRSVPQLHVSIQSEAQQRVMAIQGVSNWSFTDADGVGGGELTDSLHSLQLSQADLSRVTLYLHYEINEIELEFDAPPQSLYVTRWNAIYADTQYIGDAVDENVPVGLNGNTISIIDDGYAYVYEVRAVWEQGLAYYTFRTESAR